MAGIILAGGLTSSGALAPDTARAFLARAVRTVVSVTPGTATIVTSTDIGAGIPGARLVRNLYPDTGALGEIITGLADLQGARYHIVLCCSLPLALPAVLKLLVNAAIGSDAAIPEVAGRLEPLCAVYHSRCANKLMAFLETGNFSAREAVNSLTLKRVGEGVLRRIDPKLETFRSANGPAA